MLVYGKCECFVMQMLYVCVLCASCGPFNAAFCMTCSLLMLVEDGGDHIEVPKRQPARGWNATDICTNCVNTTLSPEMGARFWASRPSLPAAWLALLLTKVGDGESTPGPTTHTNTHAPVIWICDLCHK